MAPNNLEDKCALAKKAGMALADAPPGEEICISGLAGVFPDSDNVYQFRENLFSKYDMVTEDERRWSIAHTEIPKRTGKINHIEKFDASFFGIHYKQAHSMDPMCRVLMEKSYEAVIDAGLNPLELKGTNTGVFIGACFSESEKTWFYEKQQPYGFGVTGCSRAMLANRISYWLGVNGPSYTVDSACSSSLYALEHAYKAMRDGECNQALVGGSNLCLHPYLSLQFSRLGVLSPDGMCKSFDAKANGYARSEAISVIFLQKTRDCKRIYATVVHAKTNCDGYKEQGITYPSGRMQQQLLDQFYEECLVDPREMAWIEAHGTGTRVGDPEEMSALDAVFCKGRATPLPIGSVKSNIGHSEPASGICSVAKVIIAMETSLIPPNLHFNTPKGEIKSIVEGRVQVVTEPQPWDGGYVGVNSFGFGGANAHVLLRWNAKTKVNGGAPKDVIPRLVTVSARTQRGVENFLDDLESRPVDAEYVRLYHDIHSLSTPGHMYRGFTLLSPHKPTRHVSQFSVEKRPIWFLFSGLDCHWSGMGTSLLNIPAFSSVIGRCQAALKAKGLDVRHIITKGKMEDIVHASVAVAAMQLGLVNVLETIGIRPEGVIGYSIGELAASYADNCLTVEQTILAAYYRAIALQETEFIKGAMALVELSCAAVKALLPAEVEVACRNGPDSCVVAGPARAIATLIKTLAASGVAAKELRSGHVAAHSRYVASVGPTIMKYLRKVIPTPKPRSKRWISSSVTESQWPSHLGRLASAEYFSNNLLSPVLLHEAMKHVPSNAVLVEVSPTSSLLSVVGKHGEHVALMAENEGGMESVLTAVGHLYEAGCVPQLASLYPAVTFPVSRSTPMISPLVGWEHSHDWYVTAFQANEKFKAGERDISINITNEDTMFYAGHIVDGRNLFPATGYLVLVWETLAQMGDHSITEIAVVFENVRFHRATNIPKDGTVDFIVMVQKGSGNFEVVEGGAAIVTGRIFIPEDITTEMISLPPPRTDGNGSDGLIDYTSKDLYKELRLRGYNYSGLFRSIVSSNYHGTRGKIRWANNWVAFMDNMLQMQIMTEDTRGLFVPTSIDKLSINPFLHLEMVHAMQGEVLEKDLNLCPTMEAIFDVYVHKTVKTIQSGGIEIRGLNASAISRRKPFGDPVIEKYQFVANTNESPMPDVTLDMTEILRILIHVGLENQLGLKVKAIELVDNETDAEKPLIAPTLAAILGDWPLIQAEISVFSAPGNPLTADLGADVAVVEDRKLSGETNCMFVVATNVLGRMEVLQTVLACVGNGGYIVAREKTQQSTKMEALVVINEYQLADEKIVLLKKAIAMIDPLVWNITTEDYGWMSELQKAMKREKSVQRLLLVAQRNPMSGILGFFNCIRREPGGENARCYFILDDDAPPFEPEAPFYRNQFKKDVAMNIYKGGRWGSYRHLALEDCANVLAKHAYVNITVRGDLSSFRWIEGPLDPETFVAKPKQTLVHVYVSALNFRDVMTATGKLAAEVIAKGRLNQDCVQGLEFAGRTTDGKRVMGKITAGAMATMVVADTDLLWDIPDEWSLEDAATVPVVYGTSYYALLLHGRMQKGDSILIHAGSGGVGQAAIHIALFEGCTVYTTVGTQEKRDFIKKTFPQLTDRHIGNSRDTSFEQLVMTETGGRGVDIVLNSLSEEKLQASVRCLAVGGRFLEIGKFDLANNSPLGMEVFLRETSFHGIMLDNLFNAPSEMKKPLHYILSKGIREGAVKPLSRTVFSDSEVEQAFRFMAAGKHIGKVLLSIRPEEKELVIPPVTSPKLAMPRYLCNPSHTYVIVGGLGGFGLELADWLVLRGARKLMLTSRTGLKTGYQSARLYAWQGYGADTRISTNDISTEEGVTKLLTEANKLGPVAAIFNLAVVLADNFFENQTPESFTTSLGPKATATHHLDMISRRLCPRLKHFVAFSSVSCGRGNAGQTNYGMSNSVMERICEGRVEAGYPGLAVQWGAVGEVGLVAEMQEEQTEVVIGGTLQQRIASCLHVLDGFLRQSHPVVASMVVAEKRAGSGGAGGIVDCVVNILGLRDLKTVSLHSTLAELGMDSMMAVEIKQTLEREFEVFLSPQDIRGLTFAKLIELASMDPEANKKVSEVNVAGLEMMLRAVGDEASAAHPLIRLPSLVGENETPAGLPTAFLVPGIEGMAAALEPLALNLSSVAVGLQLGYENTKEISVREMALSLLPRVKEMLPAGTPYTVIGHSFGGLVALELAMLLENEGHLGQLFILDGAPDFLCQVCETMLVDGSEDKLQASVLMRIYSLLKTNDTATAEKMESEILAMPTWQAKLDYFLTLRPDSEHSLDFCRRIATATYRRIQSITAFTWPQHSKLKAKVTLIHPNTISQSTSDQGLSKYCSNPVDVHTVEGDHVSMLESKHVANIINTKVSEYVQQLEESDKAACNKTTQMPKLFRYNSKIH